MVKSSRLVFWGLCILLVLTGCSKDQPAESGETAVATISTPAAAVAVTASIPPSPTPIPPTATPSEPLAATVNDQPIYLAAFERELARFEQAQAELGLPVDDLHYRQVVLDTLIERELIAQAAEAEGIVVSPEQVDTKLAELQSSAEGGDNFDAWLDANQYTLAEFREALTNEMLAAQMRDAVVADVPFAVAQVHARYIQVDDEALAQSIRQQILAGEDFAELAATYSLDKKTAVNGGDLDFFPEWGLLVQEVAAAAFALQPGETSPLIAVPNADNGITYYLVQVMERDEERPLTANMRYLLMTQTFESWLQTQAEQASVIRLLEPGA